MQNMSKFVIYANNHYSCLVIVTNITETTVSTNVIIACCTVLFSLYFTTNSTLSLSLLHTIHSRQQTF